LRKRFHKTLLEDRPRCLRDGEGKFKDFLRKSGGGYSFSQ
jgi:hypothetical protein